MVQLARDLQEIVDRLVTSGRFDTEEAVFRRALVDLAAREQVVADLQEAYHDVRAGRGKSLEEMDRDMRARYEYVRGV